MPKWKRDHDIPWKIEYAALEAVLSACAPRVGRGMLRLMSDVVTPLNVATEGRYHVERELGEGGTILP